MALKDLPRERLEEIIKEYIVIGIGNRGIFKDSFVMEHAMRNDEAVALVNELGMEKYNVNSNYYDFYKINESEKKE